MSLEANSSEYRQKSFPGRNRGGGFIVCVPVDRSSHRPVFVSAVLPEDEPRICLRDSAWLWLMGCLTSELARMRGLYTCVWKEHL